MEEGGGPEILESSSKKLGLKFWKMLDEEKSTPGVGNVPKVRQSDGDVLFRKDRPNFLEQGGGELNDME